jgi:N-methylhydantoinase A
MPAIRQHLEGLRMGSGIASTTGVNNGPDWKVGVDIGGTFMDFCALETRSGRVASLKVLTTPEDPGAELMTGISLLAEREGLDPTQVSRFVHGTTVGINTVIQQKGATLALFTNAGFEDVIELARLRMPETYSLLSSRPSPLISRDMIFGIPARMRYDGRETTAPDMAVVRSAIAQARKGGAAGIIVSFLHAWRNAAQETTVKAEIERTAPDLFVFTSAEVWPVIREYERTSTAILNGYVHPRIAAYLTALEERLQSCGVPALPLLTKSNGGVMNAAEGKRACVNMLLSGTASGVIGASWLARQAGENKILTLDIGGTSADFALIIDGQPQFGTGELIGEYPLYIPTVSVSSIGIGGGSIVSLDAQGVLRVGPESAGSTPGPACYGRGGTRATVTDAMVVCGWLGHSQMAYGQLQIDIQLANKVIGELATALGRTIMQTAQAVIDIAVSEMLVEVEKLCSRSGVDLREFTLMPFGGGGPMLGAFLARELGIKRVMAPRWPGVISALGGLVADLRGDFIRTVFLPLTSASLARLAEEFDAMAQEGRDWLAAQKHEGDVQLRLACDMRYAGQSYEVEVGLQPEWLSQANVKAVETALHATHQRIYDFHDPNGAIEIVNVRVSAIGAGPTLAFAEPDVGKTLLEPKTEVSVYTGLTFETIPLYSRSDLFHGASFVGPAIVAQDDSTFAIPGSTTATIDRHLNIQVTFQE